MSKSSQRKRSMSELGAHDAPIYRYPIYPKSKEYMKGWNSVRKSKKLTPYTAAPIIIFTIIVVIFIGAMLQL